MSLALVLPVQAANFKLFLKGGGDILVSDYEVLEDRVRYYSLERSAWEEIPLEMVDLDRTKQMREREEAARAERKREDQIERKAERKARTELHNVPLGEGVYYFDGKQAVGVPQAEVILNGSKKRALLQVLAPIPIVGGKTTMEVAGKQSAFTAAEARPMFYARLDKLSRFGIVRMNMEKKKNRVAQVVQTVPKTKEMFEEQEEVEVFRQQLAPNVYKVWPVEPLPAGEYAFIDYTPGEGDIRIWDFSCQPSGAQVTQDQASP